MSLLEPLQEREHLEGRTHLEATVGRVVGHGLAALDAVGRILCHSEHFAGAWVQRHERVIQAGGIAHGNRLRQGGVGRVLLRGIQRRTDRDALSLEQALALDARRAECRVLQELGEDVVAEVCLRGIGARAALRGDRRVQHRIDRRRDALVVLFLRDDTLVEHRCQDRVTAFLSGFRVGQGIVLDGGLDEAGEERSLQVVQLRRRLGEVALRGGLDTVGDGAEGGDVEVARQDFFLRLVLLQCQRVLDFAQLTLSGLLSCRAHLVRVAFEVAALCQRVAHVLLGDRRSALAAALAQVRHERTGDTRGIDAVVLVEALIFDRDDRLLHDVSDVGAGHHDALLVVEVRDHAAGRIEELGLLGRGHGLHVTGQLVEDGRDRLRGQRGGSRDGDEHAGCDDAHERGHAQERQQQCEQLGRSDSARVRVRHIPSLRVGSLIWRVAARENCLMSHLERPSTVVAAFAPAHVCVYGHRQGSEYSEVEFHDVNARRRPELGRPRALRVHRTGRAVRAGCLPASGSCALL